MRTVPLVFTAAEVAQVDFGAGPLLDDETGRRRRSCTPPTPALPFIISASSSPGICAPVKSPSGARCASTCRLRVTGTGARNRLPSLVLAAHSIMARRSIAPSRRCRPQLLHEPSFEQSGPYLSGARLARDVGNYASTSAPDSRVEEPKIVVSNQLSRVVHLSSPKICLNDPSHRSRRAEAAIAKQWLDIFTHRSRQNQRSPDGLRPERDRREDLHNYSHI